MNIKQLREQHPRAFDAAYTTWREGEGDPVYDWYDATIEGIVEDAKERGFHIGVRSHDRNRPAFFFSGFSSQGDGASWEGNVLIPQWLEWMKREGKGTSFTDQQLLFMHEAWRNGYMSTTLGLRTVGNYSHSGTMCLTESLELDEGYDHEVREGIFKGMDAETFVNLARDTISMEDLEREVFGAACAFADDAYRTLEKEFEYLTSEEYFIESMEDRVFDEEGNETEAA